MQFQYIKTVYDAIKHQQEVDSIAETPAKNDQSAALAHKRHGKSLQNFSTLSRRYRPMVSKIIGVESREFIITVNLLRESARATFFTEIAESRSSIRFIFLSD